MIINKIIIISVIGENALREPRIQFSDYPLDGRCRSIFENECYHNIPGFS